MNEMSARGSQVTARPGTKRWANQARARRVFFAVLESGSRADARRHADRAAAFAAEAEQHEAEAAAMQDRINVLTMLMLAVEPAQGNG